MRIAELRICGVNLSFNPLFMRGKIQRLYRLTVKDDGMVVSIPYS